MKTYTIHLIRNGLTEENVEGRYIGHTDVPLSEEGLSQLEQMAEDYDYPRVEAVFSSPLKRCTQTAEKLFENPPILINELMEYNFGEFEGKTAEELKKQPLFERWLAGEDIAPPFGETNSQFSQRICSAFERIADGMVSTGVSTAAIVTHGGIVMALLAAYGLPEAPMHEWLTPPGCGYTLRLIPQLWLSGRKLEVCAETPAQEMTFEQEKSLWGQD